MSIIAIAHKATVTATLASHVTMGSQSGVKGGYVTSDYGRKLQNVVQKWPRPSLDRLCFFPITDVQVYNKISTTIYNSNDRRPVKCEKKKYREKFKKKMKKEK